MLLKKPNKLMKRQIISVTSIQTNVSLKALFSKMRSKLENKIKDFIHRKLLVLNFLSIQTLILKCIKCSPIP
jgi:hypothetical protein